MAEVRPKKVTATRLSVNINDDTAQALLRLASRRGINYTEAVRRAIAVWAFIEDEIHEKHVVQVLDPEVGETRELVLL